LYYFSVLKLDLIREVAFGWSDLLRQRLVNIHDICIIF
jgi:hypothetical protein